MYKFSEFSLAMDYVGGDLDHDISAGELALIYSVLPELMLDVIAGNGFTVDLTPE